MLESSESATPLRMPKFRRRTHLTMTVHPDTDCRLGALSNRFRLPKGQIVDKLVMALSRCWRADGEVAHLTCVNGEACRMARTDVPEVL
ncbi:MAG: hypothetical protein MUQ56_00255 [Thermoleophilia bacterium]|nr:hypothetical protein [Thermoleophilia bacterium]